MINMTKRMSYYAVCVTVLSWVGLAAHGQDAGESSLEVTIRLLPENAVGPGELTRQIELPPAAQANSAAAPPADPANGPPPGAENGQGRGLDVAEEARARGREFGQEIAEQAKETREDAGRPDSAGPPDGAGPPADPGPPPTPPGRP